MQKKHKIRKPSEEKSTVISMRDTCGWGRILFDACCVFNLNLAQYWREYAGKYGSGEIDYDVELRRADELDEERKRIASEKESRKGEIKRYSKEALDAYSGYKSRAMVGSMVANWRKAMLSGGAQSGHERYFDAVKMRDEMMMQYREMKRRQAEATSLLRQYSDDNLYRTRDLANESNAIRKHVGMRHIRLARPMEEDIDSMYDFITSEGQAERLMGMCISIVNKFSGRAFCTTMDLRDRERIAENIYEFFRQYRHTYDFLTGCYEIGDDGALRLRPFDFLEKKFYNGYYMTVKGYVQRAYLKAKGEKIGVESLDEKLERNANHSVLDGGECRPEEGFAQQESVFSCRPSDELDDGMVTFWDECRAFLESHAPEMASEVRSGMSERFPLMAYYRDGSDGVAERMSSLIRKTIMGIDAELSERRNVGVKMRQIVLDALGGAENRNEWRCCTDLVSAAIFRKMTEFFTAETGKDAEEWPIERYEIGVRPVRLVEEGTERNGKIGDGAGKQDRRHDNDEEDGKREAGNGAFQPDGRP